MATKGGRPENKNYPKEAFEYEDFGSWTLYLWSWLVVIVALAIAVIFGLLIAGGVVLLGATL